jgi:hypothetical protein
MSQQTAAKTLGLAVIGLLQWATYLLVREKAFSDSQINLVSLYD